jgi:hypothetical protein
MLSVPQHFEELEDFPEFKDYYDDFQLKKIDELL